MLTVMASFHNGPQYPLHPMHYGPVYRHPPPMPYHHYPYPPHPHAPPFSNSAPVSPALLPRLPAYGGHPHPPTHLYHSYHHGPPPLDPLPAYHPWPSTEQIAGPSKLPHAAVTPSQPSTSDSPAPSHASTPAGKKDEWLKHVKTLPYRKGEQKQFVCQWNLGDKICDFTGKRSLAKRHVEVVHLKTE